jgi:hypothetical protein
MANFFLVQGRSARKAASSIVMFSSYLYLVNPFLLGRYVKLKYQSDYEALLPS